MASVIFLSIIMLALSTMGVYLLYYMIKTESYEHFVVLILLSAIILAVGNELYQNLQKIDNLQKG